MKDEAVRKVKHFIAKVYLKMKGERCSISSGTCLGMRNIYINTLIDKISTQRAREVGR